MITPMQQSTACTTSTNCNHRASQEGLEGRATSTTATYRYHASHHLPPSPGVGEGTLAMGHCCSCQSVPHSCLFTSGWPMRQHWCLYTYSQRKYTAGAGLHHISRNMHSSAAQKHITRSLIHAYTHPKTPPHPTPTPSSHTSASCYWLYCWHEPPGPAAASARCSLQLLLLSLLVLLLPVLLSRRHCSDARCLSSRRRCRCMSCRGPCVAPQQCCCACRALEAPKNAVSCCCCCGSAWGWAAQQHQQLLVDGERAPAAVHHVHIHLRYTQHTTYAHTVSVAAMTCRTWPIVLCTALGIKGHLPKHVATQVCAAYGTIAPSCKRVTAAHRHTVRVQFQLQDSLKAVTPPPPMHSVNKAVFLNHQASLPVQGAGVRLSQGPGPGQSSTHARSHWAVAPHHPVTTHQACRDQQQLRQRQRPQESTLLLLVHLLALLRCLHQTASAVAAAAVAVGVEAHEVRLGHFHLGQAPLVGRILHRELRMTRQTALPAPAAVAAAAGVRQCPAAGTRCLRAAVTAAGLLPQQGREGHPAQGCLTSQHTQSVPQPLPAAPAAAP
jgi:hypothetical protein